MVKEQLYDRGISDGRVLEAMLRVPRHIFLGHKAGSEAYSDHSFPIGYSQTMSQPYIVGYMAEQLELTGDERVLEIGTGSGYTTAVLASLAHEVFTVERIPELTARATGHLHELLFTNVNVMSDDGACGWPEHAPFDRMLLTAAAKKVPKALLLQLADGGIFVGPVEREDGQQELVKLRRDGNEFSIERLMDCSFVPLVREGSASPGLAAGGQSERHGG